MTDSEKLKFYGLNATGEQESLEPLIKKLQSLDDVYPYIEGNGKAYVAPGPYSGYTVIDVLPELTGLPLNNLVMAHVVALRPSAVRVSWGEVCCDARTWRVTIHVDPVIKTTRSVSKSTTPLRAIVTKITQEVQVGYASGSDIALMLHHAKEGTAPPKEITRGGAIGDMSRIAQADFK